MATHMSRRHMLRLTASTVGGVAAITGNTSARPSETVERSQPLAPSQLQGARPHWEKTYSGGPVQVKPLPPGLPGKDYHPVVVPTGYTLPCKIVDGVKVFHLIVEEVEHHFDTGLRAHRCRHLLSEHAGNE